MSLLRVRRRHHHPLRYGKVKATETGKKKDEGMYIVTGGVNGIKEGKGCESPFARMRHKKGAC